MSISEGFRGWVAGFIDGDGNIGIHKQKRSLKQGLVHIGYYVSVQLTNTKKEALEAIQAVYKGRINPGRHGEWGGYLVYHMVIAGNQAVRLLKDVYPFLVLKREHAELCLELAESITKFKHQRRSRYNYVPESEWRHREELYQRVLEANRRGVERHVELDDFISPKCKSNPQIPLFGLREWLVEEGEASPEVAAEIAHQLDGRSQDVRDAVRVARLSPQLGVEKAIRLLLGG